MNLNVINILIFAFFLSVAMRAQEQSFIVLGDIHYDRIQDHDMKWLNTKPDDVRQVK